MMLVTREKGSSRDPYPPTTVSLLTKPRSDFTSARTTRIWFTSMDKTSPVLPRRSDGGRRSSRRTGRKRARARMAVDRTDQEADRLKGDQVIVAGVDARRRRVVLNRGGAVAEAGPLGPPNVRRQVESGP